MRLCSNVALKVLRMGQKKWTRGMRHEAIVVQRAC